MGRTLLTDPSISTTLGDPRVSLPNLILYGVLTVSISTSPISSTMFWSPLVTNSL